MQLEVTRSESEGASLRPRVADVSEEPYAAVQTLIEPEQKAYFERKSGETVLIIP